MSSAAEPRPQWPSSRQTAPGLRRESLQPATSSASGTAAADQKRKKRKKSLATTAPLMDASIKSSSAKYDRGRSWTSQEATTAQTPTRALRSSIETPMPSTPR